MAIATDLGARLRGRRLEPQLLRGVLLRQDVGQPDQCRLVLENAGRRPEVAVGDALVVELGLGARAEPLFVGEVVALEVSYDVAGPSTLTVIGFCRMHRLLRGRRTRSFQDMTDQDIAASIAREAGLAFRAGPPGIRHRHVLQANQTDYQFLRQRAARSGLELALVAGRTLELGRPDLALEHGITLRLGPGALQRFAPRLSLASTVSEVHVRGWDPVRRREIVGKASAPRASMGRSHGGEQARELYGDVVHHETDDQVTSQAEADARARALLEERLLETVTGEAVVKGDPRLRAGLNIEVEIAADRRFSGRYRVTGALHRWHPTQGPAGGGYRTTLELRRNATGAEERAPADARPGVVAARDRVAAQVAPAPAPQPPVEATPLNGIRLQLVDGFGNGMLAQAEVRFAGGSRAGALPAEGKSFQPLPPGQVSVRFPGLERPADDAHGEEGDPIRLPHRVSRRRPAQELALPTGGSHRVQLEPRAASALELAHYRDRGALWLPGGAPGAPSATGIDELAAVLRHAREQPDHELLVTGHAAAPEAQELSAARAEGAMLLVTASEAWPGFAAEHARADELQANLAWAAEALGLGCHPGPIDGRVGPRTRAAVARFVTAYRDLCGGELPADGLGGDGRAPVEVWAALFALYWREVARVLEVDAAEARRQAGALTPLGGRARPAPAPPPAPLPARAADADEQDRPPHGGRTPHYPYLRIARDNSLYPAQLARHARGPGHDADYIKDLNPLNRHLCDASGNWKAWLVPGDEINLPPDYVVPLRRHTGQRYRIVEAPATPPPPPLLAPGLPWFACQAHHLDKPGAAARRGGHRRAEVLFVSPGDVPVVCQGGAAPCRSSSCDLYDPREYAISYLAVSHTPAELPWVVVVLDDLDRPLAGIDVRFELPSFSGVVTSGDDGRARALSTPGAGRAWLADRGRIADALRGRAGEPRRTAALPAKQDARHLARIPGRAEEPFDLVPWVATRVSVCCRSDLAIEVLPECWGTLTVARGGDAVVLVPGPAPRFQLLSLGEGARVRVVGEGYPDGGAPPVLLDVDVDALHEALFRGDVAAQSKLLDRITLYPPLPPPVELDTSAELALFEQHHAAALAGSGEGEPT